jgi:2'-5' RNA ligase
VSSIHQYLFTIILEPELEQQVVHFKKELFEQIGEYSSMRSRPHITIGTMLIDQSKEEHLLKLIGGVCANTVPFQIHFNGFGCFKAHTVFAKLDQLQAVRNFMTACEKSTLGFPAKKKWKPKAKNPHLTVGRELAKNYPLAKEYFLEKPFVSSSWINGLRVQRRPENGTYAVIGMLAFGENTND